MSCQLDYIPEHLRQGDRLPIDVFTVGENLHYRVRPEIAQKPYDKIPLLDISHNRDFNDPLTYLLDDVFYNIDPNSDDERYEGLEAITLEIKQLDSITFERSYSTPCGTHTVVLKLKHDPVPCMYPHSVFELTFDNVVVDKGNYKTGFGKDNKILSNLRSRVRQDFTSMMQCGIIDNQEIEDIDL